MVVGLDLSSGLSICWTRQLTSCWHALIVIWRDCWFSGSNNWKGKVEERFYSSWFEIVLICGRFEKYPPPEPEQGKSQYGRLWARIKMEEAFGCTSRTRVFSFFPCVDLCWNIQVRVLYRLLALEFGLIKTISEVLKLMDGMCPWLL